MRISRTTAAAIIGSVIALIGVVTWESVYRSGGEGPSPFAWGSGSVAGPAGPDDPAAPGSPAQDPGAGPAPAPAHHGPYAALYAARDIQLALEDLKQRKVAVSSHELSAQDIAAEKALAASFDPSVALSRRLTELRGPATDRKALAALADQVVDLGSPRLFGELYQALLTERQGEPVLLLGGRPHGGLSSAMALQAWNLAACEVSGSCGLQNFRMQYDCALGASCFTDAREYHLAQAQRTEDTRAAFEQLRASILTNLQARNWAYFGAP